VQLAEVVPWGRSFNEYRQMFDLTAADLEKRILGCADGPASFNAEVTARGGQIVSVDPLYGFSPKQIQARIAETRELVLQQVRANQTDFIWQQISSVEHLVDLRDSAMEIFLQDFSAGLREGRYLEAQLPNLPFADNSFELALCSHFLFLYSEQLSRDFHCQALRELCRVAAEVRVFPLVKLDGRSSEHISPLVDELVAEGFSIEIRRVEYEFQKGGNKLMRLCLPCDKLSSSK